jgi:hypothetical protein
VTGSTAIIPIIQKLKIANTDDKQPSAVISGYYWAFVANFLVKAFPFLTIGKKTGNSAVVGLAVCG